MERATNIYDVLAAEGFAPPLYVEGREAIANLFAKSKRCGIYVLHFADGMAYVGLSVDVARRYVEHRRNHRDIQQISFKTYKAADLPWAERHTREVLQSHGFPLRGVVGVVQLPGGAEFDLVMDPQDQDRWLADSTIVDMRGSRMVNPALRATYAGKFARLSTKPQFDQALEVLRRYVAIGIPKARAAEDSFWACSCLPKSNVYSRININWQEVLSVFEVDGELMFSFHFARSQLENGDLFAEYFGRTHHLIPFGLTMDDEGFLPVFENITQEELDELLELVDFTVPEALHGTLADLFDAYDRLMIFGQGYAPGGEDQINFIVPGPDQALDLLHEDDVVRAIRQFNLRLMRMGPSPYKTSHCLDLADLLVGEGD